MTASALGGPRRIVVTGQGGSGKTTLARRLGARLGLTVYEFDDIAYDPVSHRRRGDAERLAMVARIAAQPGWVADCWYLGWTEELLRRADLIIWLDLPWRVAARRIVLRHLRATLARNNPHPGWRRLLAFLRAERARYTAPASPPAELLQRDGANNWATHARVLAGYGDKVRRVT